MNSTLALTARKFPGKTNWKNLIVFLVINWQETKIQNIFYLNFVQFKHGFHYNALLKKRCSIQPVPVGINGFSEVICFQFSMMNFTDFVEVKTQQFSQRFCHQLTIRTISRRLIKTHCSKALRIHHVISVGCKSSIGTERFTHQPEPKQKYFFKKFVEDNLGWFQKFTKIQIW